MVDFSIQILFDFWILVDCYYPLPNINPSLISYISQMEYNIMLFICIMVRGLRAGPFYEQRLGLLASHSLFLASPAAPERTPL